MSKLALRVVMFGVVALLPSASWGVTNAVVGTCVSGTQFITIQEAVDAAAAASTVKVCPGTYPEQVMINKPLTLNGLALGRSVVVVPPAGGLVANGITGTTPFAAQILVENATVTINNIGVDGNAQGGACLAVGRWIGIAYQQAGGAIKNLVVRNGPLCADTTAILADTTTNLKIMNNSIHQCLYCIEMKSGVNTTISSNIVLQAGLTSYWGVRVEDSPGPTTISSNTIIGTQTGVYAINSQSVSVTNNTIATDQYAIGIQLIGASNHVVQNNRISYADQAIAIDDTGAMGKNSVLNNTINDANCGISVGPNSIDTVSPNTFYVVGGWYCP